MKSIVFSIISSNNLLTLRHPASHQLDAIWINNYVIHLLLNKSFIGTITIPFAFCHPSTFSLPAKSFPLLSNFPNTLPVFLFSRPASTRRRAHPFHIICIYNTYNPLKFVTSARYARTNRFLLRLKLKFIDLIKMVGEGL